MFLSIWAFVLFLHHGLRALLAFLERHIVGPQAEVEVVVSRQPVAFQGEPLLLRSEVSPRRIGPESIPMVSGRKKRWYAVRKGFRPGIYSSWAECEKIVRGYSGAEFRGFRTLVEAKDYMRV